jgi:Phage integrase central domain
VREKRIEISADRRKSVRGTRDEYVDYVKSLDGSRGEKAPATIEDTETKLDRYIVPALGHLPMAAVTEREIETLARSARHRSESTVRSILSVGSQFFAWGLRQRYCDHNPVKRAREIYGDTLLPHSEPKDAAGTHGRGGRRRAQTAE